MELLVQVPDGGNLAGPLGFSVSDMHALLCSCLADPVVWVEVEDSFGPWVCSANGSVCS